MARRNAKKAPAKRPRRAPKRAAPRPKRKAPAAPKRRAARPSVREAPASIGSRIARSVPSFSGGSNRITIAHRELIGTMASVGDGWAEIRRLSLNPGNATAFPWLAGMAWSWESYTWRKLQFTYEPRCASTQIGAIQMFADYDVADSSPINEQAASSYDGYLECNPWMRATNTLNNVAMRQGKAMKYVTPAAGYPASADPTNYSSGAFFFYSVGTGAAVTLGSLWVEYVVDLITPTAGAGVSLELGQTSAALLLNEDTVACPAYPGPGSYNCDSFINMFADIVETDFQYPPGKERKITFDEIKGEWNIPGPGIYQLDASQLFTTPSHVSFSQRPYLGDLIDVASTGLEYLGDIIGPSYLQAANTYILGGIFAVTGASGILRLAAPGPYTSWSFNVDTAGMSRVYTQLAINFLTSYSAALAGAESPHFDLPRRTRLPADSKLAPHRHKDLYQHEVAEDELDDIEDMTLPGTATARLASPPASVQTLQSTAGPSVGRSSKRPKG